MGLIAYDVCVVGAGPAGAAAAIRLAKLGRRVCLLGNATATRRGTTESLSVGAEIILEFLGPVVVPQARPQSIRVRELHALWTTERVEKVQLRQSPGGLVVDRFAFDQLLVREAMRAGADVLQPARALGAERDVDAWTVTIQRSCGVRQLRSTFLIDAGGRGSRLLATQRGRSARTIALSGQIEGDDWGDAMRLEALADGWCWGAPAPAGGLGVVLFTDPGELRSSPTHFEATWRGRLSQSTLFYKAAERRLIGALRGRDATVSSTADIAVTGGIRVGEAALSLDPLSSSGVERAMRSGLDAAVAIHTSLDWPSRAELCLRFCRDRHAEAVREHTGWSAEFYASVTRFALSPFWQARARQNDAASAAEPQTAAAPSGPDTVLELSPDVRFVDTPCLVGDEIVAELAVEAPALGRPVAFVEGVAIAVLLRRAPNPISLGALGNFVGSWGLGAALSSRVCGWLLEKRLLQVRESAVGGGGYAPRL